MTLCHSRCRFEEFIQSRHFFQQSAFELSVIHFECVSFCLINHNFTLNCLLLSSYMSTVELHLSGLIGKASHEDMQKIQFFFFSRGYISSFNFGCCYLQWGTRWLSWLRHCATSQKVAVSIPVGVIGIFH